MQHKQAVKNIHGCGFYSVAMKEKPGKDNRHRQFHQEPSQPVVYHWSPGVPRVAAVRNRDAQQNRKQNHGQRHPRKQQLVIKLFRNHQSNVLMFFKPFERVGHGFL